MFYRQWELTGEAYEVTETGSFQTGVTIADAAVYPCDAPVAESNAFTDVMCAVTSKAEYVDEMMHTNVPYTLETGDYGSALDSLIRKGLITLDGDEVYLSPEASMSMTSLPDGSSPKCCSHGSSRPTTSTKATRRDAP